ncbi:MAG TPA: NAD(P)/FAD-dependent oxidoreductase, partial [Telluria sp.]|nr:NAD(P)/FAD-dependent oxidoreductase [Telluria sp.]
MNVPTHPTVAIIGGGPAGLMAAEVLAAAGVQVDLYDAMPSVARKFLLAGKGGMNITHSEERLAFQGRYGARAGEVGAWLDQFDGAAVRDWIHALGIDTFIGSSGRVFPLEMKAAPLLRAWLHRLRESGVRFHMRHRCTHFDKD